MTIKATWAFNGQTKIILGNWHRLWCLLFGPFYYLFKGMFLWAIVSFFSSRPVGRLPLVQPRYRAAPLPSQGVGAGMTASTSAQAVCHPSGTRRTIPNPSANADRMKRLGNLGPAYARQTDR